MTRFRKAGAIPTLAALIVIVAAAGTSPGLAQNDSPALETGQRPMGPEMFLRTGDVVTLCLLANERWKSFCHGLAQAYAEYAVFSGNACIPVGTSREELVQTFIGPDIVVSNGYIDDLPAMETALEMFIRHYPCD